MSGGISVWKYLGGKTRRYRNLETGVEISRRQYDQLFGRLKHVGAGGYEKAAAATRERTPELAAKRPSRGKSILRVKNLKNLSPTIGKVGRVIADGAFAETYDATVSELEKNKKIGAAMAGAYYERTDDTTGNVARWTKWLPNKHGNVNLSDLELLLSGQDAEYVVINNLFPEKSNAHGKVTGEYEHFLYYVFYIRFGSDYVKPKPQPTEKQRKRVSRRKARNRKRNKKR